jgi:prolipoprotein diacylglyceryl transferase
MLASIPSPGSNAIGPFRAYGLMIAIGVIAGVELARRRFRARGGDPEDITTIALWAVPAGLIGARLYHVITDWRDYFPDRPVDALKLWEGGLGIPGGIILGVAVGVYVGHRKGIRLPVGLDVVAPALPLAQAIGRLGNWFNQEVFGRPTDLPWGLEIDPARRPLGYEQDATFHPTFLYEGLWNLALMGVLIWIDRRRVLRPGNVFVLYVGGYGLGRLWVESLRIDEASLVLGLRVNIWTSLIAIAAAVAVLAVRGLRRRPDDVDGPYVDGHVFRPDGGEPSESVGDEHPPASSG